MVVSEDDIGSNERKQRTSVVRGTEERMSIWEYREIREYVTFSLVLTLKIRLLAPVATVTSARSICII